MSASLRTQAALVGTPLETFPDKFLNQTGELLLCSTHGARFRITDGFCVEGPCKGQTLNSLAVRIEDGFVVLANNALPAD